jgi:hypothetical protein
VNLYLVVDVESIGLHGEGYAAGWVVVDGHGVEQASGRWACPPEAALGNEAARVWVAANVPDLPATHATPREVRDGFWRLWLSWKDRGAVLAADCPWPVEARFLAGCVDDDPTRREWEGPYPLIDVASVRLAAGFDPLGTTERRPGELPEHDPLADARQSARLLVEALGCNSCQLPVVSC